MGPCDEENDIHGAGSRHTLCSTPTRFYVRVIQCAHMAERIGYIEETMRCCKDAHVREVHEVITDPELATWRVIAIVD